ncbi:hypothetical protein Tco_1112727 [Tanacetum coccineum]|uniref:Uncharacterized protein n=1 Tax=Tanacetum coccineum TaxID=301880 RepID=A0ABQ5IQG9_9ASTR
MLTEITSSTRPRNHWSMGKQWKLKSSSTFIQRAWINIEFEDPSDEIPEIRHKRGTLEMPDQKWYLQPGGEKDLEEQLDT